LIIRSIQCGDCWASKYGESRNEKKSLRNGKPSRRNHHGEENAYGKRNEKQGQAEAVRKVSKDLE